MDSSQLPKRKAAIKATTQLADLSSSDEDNDADSEGGDYGPKAKQMTRRVKGGEPTKKPKEGKPKSKKDAVVGPKELTAAARSGRKRKRATSSVTGGPRKRYRGNKRSRSVDTAGGGSNHDSDLTPLSSDAEQEAHKSSPRPIAEFPLKFTPPPSSPNHRKTKRPRLKVFPVPTILDVDDDSDDLPDVGSVLSQQDVSPSKTANYRKHKISISKDYSKTQPKRPCDDALSSLGPSPTPPPPSTQDTLPLPFSLYSSPIHDGASTELNSNSDHYDFRDFGDDSDLELDSAVAGDLCLAKSKAGATSYWPAKILQVKKLTGPTGKQKKTFRVMFLDKLEKDIPRSWFYTPSQDGFRTCSIGQFESSHVEVINDIDEDSRQNDSSHHPGLRRSPSPRSPSPINVSPLPLSGPEYCDLSLRQQFAYVTPVLTAIMEEKYTWGLQRHELFIKGGTSRQKLLNEGGSKGAIDSQSVDELLVHVEFWCLGVRGRDFVGDDPVEERAVGCQRRDISPDDDTEKSGVAESLEQALEIKSWTGCDRESEAQNTTPAPAPDEELNDQPKLPEPAAEKPQDLELKNTPERILAEELKTQSPPPSTQTNLQLEAHSPKRKRPRQHGSPAYEMLSPLDKVQYCIEVLLPEALNQILLWRAGERKSVRVMWEDQREEERLHERGEQLLKETDWVMDIMRLRRAMEKGRGKREKEKLGSKKGNQSKDVRKTRSGRVGGVVGSYKE